ncbi:MAG: SH3 domain-containing protein, partial [Leptospiraceae bacterium]|nr:SH3 domain-containing protein [Leptospiraceae bacterium]
HLSANIQCNQNIDRPERIINQSAIVTASSLRVRKGPDKFSDQIGSVLAGEIVSIINRKKHSVTIDGLTDRWTLIKRSRPDNNTVSGWVFGGYLEYPNAELEAVISAPYAAGCDGKYYPDTFATGIWAIYKLDIINERFEIKLDDSRHNGCMLMKPCSNEVVFADESHEHVLHFEKQNLGIDMVRLRNPQNDRQFLDLMISNSGNRLSLELTPAMSSAGPIFGYYQENDRSLEDCFEFLRLQSSQYCPPGP